MFKKIFGYINQHKIITGLIILALIGGSYYTYQKLTAKPAVTRYVLAAVAKGTLVSSVTGSGQVSVSNQVEIKAKAAGAITGLTAKIGQEVKSGTILARVNATEALKNVRDAKNNLDSAKLSLAKLQQPTSELTILQAENSLAQAKESKSQAEEDKTQAEEDLTESYESAFNSVANAFLELPDVMTNLNSILFDNTINPNQDNINYYTDNAYVYDSSALQYKNDVDAKYQKARTAYDANFIKYKATSRSSSNEEIENLVQESFNTTRSIAEAIKSANNLIQFYKDKLTEKSLTPNSIANTHLATLNSDTGTTNGHLTTLLSSTTTISNKKQAIIDAERTIVNAERTIEEKTASLADLKSGTDPLDLASQQLAIKQKENALADANAKLADYSVKAPFDGVIAEVNVKNGEDVSSGTAIFTIITKQKIAEISLNEVDAAKVKADQKATLTFDAVSDLSLTGVVAQIDALGTVSQGVVSYTVQIAFDTQDERIKPGMTVSANIITSVKPDVLLVSNSAIKSSGDQNYVELPPTGTTLDTANANSGVTLNGQIQQQVVTIGEANDSDTEITSGLEENDIVIERTVSASSTTSSSKSTKSIIGGGGPGF